MKKQTNTSKLRPGRFTETNKLGEKNIENILHELKHELKRVYKNRLVSLILYGSYASGEAGADSDIDVVVVLKGDVVPGREIDYMLDTITDLGLKYNTLISIYPASEDYMQSVKSPLLLNVHAEGITL
ncbi:MAG: nucleotidyltransferase domain-containing protein [Deltaproteobacteria bacterium]|nr:nucleotidyltransferase domain-containing protein [Deltaproteobacteria bacterium]